jgi:hypothetical protein
MLPYGLEFGFALLALVIVVGVSLGAKAAKSVATFREENHEPFVGRGKS